MKLLVYDAPADPQDKPLEVREIHTLDQLANVLIMHESEKNPLRIWFDPVHQELTLEVTL